MGSAVGVGGGGRWVDRRVGVWGVEVGGLGSGGLGSGELSSSRQIVFASNRLRI